MKLKSRMIAMVVSRDQGHLFSVSIAAFGMLFGSLIAGPMANLIGRKWTCILGTCLCLSLSYALIPFAQYLWMILLGRFLMGAGLGFSMTISTLYIMEISSPSMRPGLAVVPAIAGVTRKLLNYVAFTIDENLNTHLDCP